MKHRKLLLALSLVLACLALPVQSAAQQYAKPGDATTIRTAPTVESLRISGQNVYLSLRSDLPITVYAMDGRVVKTQWGRTGNNIVRLPLRGLYIIRVGTETFKVFSK